MNWKNFWNELGQSPNDYAQVARVGGTVRQDEAVLSRIALRIVDVLDIQPGDAVLDMCCGNGLLTSKLAPHCREIVGVDFSEVLIATARKKYAGIDFMEGDAKEPGLLMPAHAGRFNKINLYFSFQYFETVEQGRAVLSNLVKLAAPGARILLGDVPDRDSFFVYYNSFGRILRLVKQMLQGANDMGKFWSVDELRLICRSCNVHGEKVKQPQGFPYSHYRMDWLITVPGEAG